MGSHADYEVKDWWRTKVNQLADGEGYFRKFVWKCIPIIVNFEPTL